MKSFHFPLQKALDLRRTQLEMAEAQLQRQLAALAELDRADAELKAAGIRTTLEVRQYRPLDGADLNALDSFGLLVKLRGKAIEARRVECRRELAALQAGLLEARRRCRLLEQLKERRWTEWQLARDHELDEMAADSYLAQWNRRPA